MASLTRPEGVEPPSTVACPRALMTGLTPISSKMSSLVAVSMVVVLLAASRGTIPCGRADWARGDRTGADGREEGGGSGSGADRTGPVAGRRSADRGRGRRRRPRGRRGAGGVAVTLEAVARPDEATRRAYWTAWAAT